MAVALARDLAVNVGFNPTRALIADVTSDGPERARGYSWMQAISGSFGVLAYAIGALFGNIVLIYAAVGIVLVLAIGPPFLIEEPRDLVPAPAQRDTDASWRGVAASLSPLDRKSTRLNSSH